MRRTAQFILAAALLAVGGSVTWLSHSMLDGASYSGSGIPLILSYQNQTPGPLPRIRGSLTIDIPRYPQSGITGLQLPLGRMAPTPGSPYVRVARSATYQVHAGVSQVMAWYTKQLARLGYGSALPGSLGNTHTGVTESALTFAKNVASPLNITMTFYGSSSQTTRYAIWATDFIPPPRPTRTNVPTDLSQLSGTVVMNGQSRRVHSQNAQALARLARRINDLKTLDTGNHCPAIFDSASLDLVAKTGQRVAVQIESGCSVTVYGISWVDAPPQPIWSALMAAIRSSH